MGNEDQLNRLVPKLLNYLESSNKVIERQEKQVEALQSCNLQMKIQIEKLLNHNQNLDKAWEERKLFCDKRYEKIEGKLDNIPTEKERENTEDKIKDLEKKLDALIPTIYKIVGGITIVPVFLGFVYFIIRLWIK